MKNILIIYKPDKGANGVRPIKIKTFLEKKGFKVSDYRLIAGGVNSVKEARKQMFRKKFIPKVIRNSVFILKGLLEGRKLARLIRSNKYYAVISETEIAALSFLFLGDETIQILDSPAPWVREWEISGDLSRIIAPLAYWLEKIIYKKVDSLSFHWENYTRYVKKHIYDGKNIININWGCENHINRAHYSKNPKIVFLGKLSGYWNNLELLSKLSKKYHIDIYGPEKPSEFLRLNYKGFAPTTEVLADYQFGLVTISNDSLRRQSFSSKHLEYMSYGLPVLTPEWRKDPILEKFSIYYNEINFLDKVHEYSKSEKWQKMSDSCYDQSKKWSWNNNLQNLLGIIYEK